MTFLGRRLSQIMEQNNSLRQSIHNHYQTENAPNNSNNKDDDIILDSTETNHVHAIPISMRAMKSKRFSELFLKQLQSHDNTINDTNDDTNTLFEKYINDN